MNEAFDRGGSFSFILQPDSNHWLKESVVTHGPWKIYQHGYESRGKRSEEKKRNSEKGKLGAAAKKLKAQKAKLKEISGEEEWDVE